MNELYWITRLAILNSLASTVMGITLSIAVIIGFFWFIAFTTYDSDSYIHAEERAYNKICYTIKKYFKAWLTVFIISLIALLAIPSKKELLFIYGVGGTIDYIKSNDKAKELPDKVIDALTRYVDSEKKDTNGTD